MFVRYNTNIEQLFGINVRENSIILKLIYRIRHLIIVDELVLLMQMRGIKNDSE